MVSESLVPQWKIKVFGELNVVLPRIYFALISVGHRTYFVLEFGHNRLSFKSRPLLSQKMIVSKSSMGSSVWLGGCCDGCCCVVPSLLALVVGF